MMTMQAAGRFRFQNARRRRWSGWGGIRGWMQDLALAHAHIWSFLAAVALCGLAFGGLVAGQLNAFDATTLAQAVQHLLQAVAQHQLLPSDQLWWQRAVADGQLLALVWLLGLSVIGMPLVVIVVFLRAFSVGFAVGFTVIQFGWKGLLVSSAVICLHQLVALTTLVCAGAIAIRFSAGILRHVYPLPGLTTAFLKYTASLMVCAAWLIAAAAIQAYVAPALLTVLLG